MVNPLGVKPSRDESTPRTNETPDAEPRKEAKPKGTASLFGDDDDDGGGLFGGAPKPAAAALKRKGAGETKAPIEAKSPAAPASGGLFGDEDASFSESIESDVVADPLDGKGANISTLRATLGQVPANEDSPPRNGT